MCASAVGRRCVALVLLAWMLFGFWAMPNAEAGLVEAAIWHKVEKLLQEGKELQACKEALKLHEYKDSPVYKKAEKKMARRGLSLEDPLSSYTMKRMVDLQNETQAVTAASGQLPKPGLRPKHKDAWGHAMRVELVTRADFVYAIRSAGPDGRFYSSDDLVVGVRDERALDPAPANPWDTARDLGRGSMIKGRGASGGGTGGAPSSAGGGARHGTGGAGMSPAAQDPAQVGGEREVTLDDLLKSK
jgi:uncharacterized membrane protein YgcG